MGGREGLAGIKNHLAVEGIPLVEQAARGLIRRLGGYVPLDDLVGIGNFALVMLIDAYQSHRGPFEKYARSRLKWMILDGLRRETHSRVTAGRVLAVMAIERFIEVVPDQAMDDMSATIEEDQAALATCLSGQAAALALGLTAVEGDFNSSSLTLSPEQLLEAADFARFLRATIAALPTRERTLVERHYYGGEQFDVIAHDLGISKSRASRLNKAAMTAIANAIKANRR